MQEARYYEVLADGVRCLLCPKECRLSEGQRGFCRVRRNEGKKLYADNYSACSSHALDPIEKKPLYHYYPGSLILSLGTWGCNFSCSFCQNWQIAAGTPPTMELLPEQAVGAARHYASQGNLGLAYTYSEPGVWYEYVLETARLNQEAGLKNILVTNGYINSQPLLELLPYIDAMNIDVKAFTEEFYQKICAGSLADVQRTVELAARHCHVEITTLLVPGLNDSRQEVQELARWLSGINPDIPLHFSRYFPNHKMKLPPTAETVLQEARQSARESMNFVYIGNAAGTGVNTYCPDCQTLLFERTSGRRYLPADRCCPGCKREIPVVE